jgi:hypothetical protein
MQSALCPVHVYYDMSFPISVSSVTSHHQPLLALPLPVRDLAEASLQWWKQTPRLHCSTQNTKAHEDDPAQRQNNSKRDPVCLDRVRHAEISRHVFGHKGEWQEQDGCFADEQRNPRKAVDSGRLRHGHQLEVLSEYVSDQEWKPGQTTCNSPFVPVHLSGEGNPCIRPERTTKSYLEVSRTGQWLHLSVRLPSAIVLLARQVCQRSPGLLCWAREILFSMPKCLSVAPSLDRQV